MFAERVGSRCDETGEVAARCEDRDGKAAPEGGVTTKGGTLGGGCGGVESSDIGCTPSLTTLGGDGGGGGALEEVVSFAADAFAFPACGVIWFGGAAPRGICHGQHMWSQYP